MHQSENGLHLDEHGYIIDMLYISGGYLFYLVGLQEIAGFSEVGFERFWLQLRLDGCALLAVHLLLGGDLQEQMKVR